jgi:hypothetical protein
VAQEEFDQATARWRLNCLAPLALDTRPDRRAALLGEADQIHLLTIRQGQDLEGQSADAATHGVATSGGSTPSGGPTGHRCGFCTAAPGRFKEVSAG